MSNASRRVWSEQRTCALLERIALIGLLAGGVATWPLWTGGQTFPQIPWFAALTRVPPITDRLLLLACGFAAVARLVAPHRFPSLTRIVFSVAAIALVLLDQHRLQVWVLHLGCVLSLIWLAPNARGLTLVRMFVISIYVHSALSRFDFASLELQWELLSPLLERIGVSTRFTPEFRRLTAGGAFAVWELTVAVLLAFPQTRRVGRWGSIAMHAGLLLILGPFGQDHHPGVLIWNAAWIAQNVVLFGRRATCETAGVVERGAMLGGRFAMVLAGMVIAGPLLEPWNYWDHWPGWRVYSARPETVACYVDSGRVADLPEAVQQYVGPPDPLSEWCALNLDAWSFAELRCPVYPQGRFRLAVVRALARAFQWGDDVRVVVDSSPDRWTGRRTTRELVGDTAITNACRQFVVNTEPRDLPIHSATLHTACATPGPDVRSTLWIRDGAEENSIWHTRCWGHGQQVGVGGAPGADPIDALRPGIQCRSQARPHASGCAISPHRRCARSIARGLRSSSASSRGSASRR